MSSSEHDIEKANEWIKGKGSGIQKSKRLDRGGTISPLNSNIERANEWIKRKKRNTEQQYRSNVEIENVPEQFSEREGIKPSIDPSPVDNGGISDMPSHISGPDLANLGSWFIKLPDPPSAKIYKQLKDGGLSKTERQNQLHLYEEELLSKINVAISRIENLIPNLNNKLSAEFYKAVNGIFLHTLTDNDISAIHQDGFDISFVPVTVPLLKRSHQTVRANEVWEDTGYTGDGITIGILDTGIWFTHKEFDDCGFDTNYDWYDSESNSNRFYNEEFFEMWKTCDKFAGASNFYPYVISKQEAGGDLDILNGITDENAANCGTYWRRIHCSGCDYENTELDPYGYTDGYDWFIIQIPPDRMAEGCGAYAPCEGFEYSEVFLDPLPDWDCVLEYYTGIGSGQIPKCLDKGEQCYDPGSSTFLGTCCYNQSPVRDTPAGGGWPEGGYQEYDDDVLAPHCDIDGEHDYQCYSPGDFYEQDLYKRGMRNPIYYNDLHGAFDEMHGNPDDTIYGSLGKYMWGGHGTLVASIAAGVGYEFPPGLDAANSSGGAWPGIARGAKLWPMKVINNWINSTRVWEFHPCTAGSCTDTWSENWGFTEQTIRAIEKSMDPYDEGTYDNHLHIINMSIGSPGNPDDVQCQAVSSATAVGVVVVAAAGNDGPASPGPCTSDLDPSGWSYSICSPGSCEDAITVGAVYSRAAGRGGSGTWNDIYSNAVLGWSGRGPTVPGEDSGQSFDKPDLVAPGSGICGASGTYIGPPGSWSGGGQDPQWVRCQDQSSNVGGDNPEGWTRTWHDNHGHRARIKSGAGTSFAAPHVAGAVALMLQKNPDLSPSEVKTILKDTAFDAKTWQRRWFCEENETWYWGYHDDECVENCSIPCIQADEEIQFPAPPEQQGAGILDVKAAIDATPGPEQAPAFTQDYYADWNLVGMPIDADNTDVDYIFPSSTEGTLYGFDGTYYELSEMELGIGYWLFFDDATTELIGLYGIDTEVSSVVVSLQAGWNLISGPSISVEVEDIYDPLNIIVPGTVYGFSGNYQNSLTLVPGKGYWINANADGDIRIGTEYVCNGINDSQSEDCGIDSPEWTCDEDMFSYTGQLHACCKSLSTGENISVWIENNSECPADICDGVNCSGSCYLCFCHPYGINACHNLNICDLVPGNECYLTSSNRGPGGDEEKYIETTDG